MLLPNVLELDKILKAHSGFSVVMLHGFLTAILSGPSIIPTSSWMRELSLQDGRGSSLYSPHTREWIQELYDSIDQGLSTGTYRLMITTEQEDSYHPQEILSSVSEWASGYSQGVRMDFKNWFPQIETQPLSNFLFPLVSFTVDDETLQNLTVFDQETKPTLQEITEFRQTNLKILPLLAQSIYNFWKKPNQNAFFNLVRRTDPCACGSGKIYAKCCLH